MTRMPPTKILLIITFEQFYYRLHFGLVAMTTFISMWISNTAATAMMCPIIVAVLEEMEAVSCKIFH